MNNNADPIKSNTFIFSRNFLPFFWVQWLGALNDNVFKNALVMIILFHLNLDLAVATQWVTAAAGIFILPFFVFSNWAGNRADHQDKVQMVRWLKLMEVGIMLLAILALWSKMVPLMMLVLFLMGTQSAFFGPIKYALLPDYLPEKSLDSANAIFSGSTFLAILLGTLIAGLLVTHSENFLQTLSWLSIIILSLAGLGFLASLWMPKVSAFNQNVKTEPTRQKRSLKALLQQARQFKLAFRAVLAISCFWLVGAVFLSQVPLFAEILTQSMPTETLKFSAEALTTIMLSCFILGIGLGAAGIVWRLRRAYDFYWVWRMGLGLGVSIGILAVALWGQVTQAIALPLELFLGLLMIIATTGGAFVVPFYRIMQCKTPQYFRASMVAANNILNAGFMVLVSIIMMIAYQLGLKLQDILLGLAIITLAAMMLLKKQAQP